MFYTACPLNQVQFLSLFIFLFIVTACPLTVSLGQWSLPSIYRHSWGPRSFHLLIISFVLLLSTSPSHFTSLFPYDFSTFYFRFGLPLNFHFAHMVRPFYSVRIICQLPQISILLRRKLSSNHIREGIANSRSSIPYVLTVNSYHILTIFFQNLKI